MSQTNNDKIKIFLEELCEHINRNAISDMRQFLLTSPANQLTKAERKADRAERKADRAERKRLRQKK